MRRGLVCVRSRKIQGDRQRLRLRLSFALLSLHVRCQLSRFYATGRFSEPRRTPRRDVAQPGSAPEWGSGGRGFKSRRPDKKNPRLSPGFFFIGPPRFSQRRFAAYGQIPYPNSPVSLPAIRSSRFSQPRFCQGDLLGAGTSIRWSVFPLRMPPAITTRSESPKPATSIV